MNTTGRDHFLGPNVGADSKAVLDDALASLGQLRIPTGWLGDGGAEIQLLTSLSAEVQRRLPGTVALAREQGYSWAEIGDLLGTTRAAAWQRFANCTTTITKQTRRQQLANLD